MSVTMAEQLTSDNPTQNVPPSSTNMQRDDGDEPLKNFKIQQRCMSIKEYMLEKRKRIKALFFDTAFNIFTNEPHYFTEETAKEAANSLLDPKKQYRPNASPFTTPGPEEGYVAFEDTQLGRLRREWLGTVHESILLLRFPVQMDAWSLDQDEQSRKLQNEKFVQLCETNAGIDHQRIDSRAGLSCSVSQFLSECTTKLATIVFNGHGTSSGLSVHQSGSVPLDEIIAEIIDLSRITEPNAIDIVFGQCYGHEHSYNDNPFEIVKITSLTNSDMQTTHGSFGPDEFGNIEADNFHLNDHARQQRRPQRAEPDEVLNLQEDQGEMPVEQTVQRTDTSLGRGSMGENRLTSGYETMDQGSTRLDDSSSLQVPGSSLEREENQAPRDNLQVEEVRPLIPASTCVDRSEEVTDVQGIAPHGIDEEISYLHGCCLYIILAVLISVAVSFYLGL